MSRICVKNIGKNTNDKQLRELFSSKGEVTDVKVITTKDGQSRRFAFVGFRTELQATEAQKHFNNTFIGLSKISVEMAKKFNDQALKESKQKIVDKKSKPTKQAKNDKNEHNEDEKKKTNGNKGDSLVEVDTTSVAGRKKAEFLEMMKSRKNSNKWANDDVAGTGTSLEADQIPTQRAKSRSADNEGASDSDSDAESDEESVNSMVVDGEGDAGVESSPLKDKQQVSDLDYLRSKITRKRTDSDFSSSDSSEGEEEEEEEGKQTASEKAEKSVDLVEIKGMKEESVEVVDGAAPAFDEEDDNEDTARLFVKNLPFSCTEEEFRALFSPFGPLSEVHLPLDEEKRGKGYGFVQYMLPEHAQAALESLSSEAFQGRVLYVVKAQRPKEKEAAAAAPGKGNVAKLSSFQLKKEEERRKAMNRKEGWNAAFVRSDAVVDSLASRHGMSSADILDTTRSGGEMAVRLAIGESQIVMENRDYFAQHGVDIDALESAHSTQKAATRSNTTLLVKNLPPSSVPDELESMFARFGSIAAFLAPPSKTMVVVDFVEPSEARAAQKGLAYRNYKHTPLYLEWAPVNAIDRKKAAQAAAATTNSKNSNKTAAASSSGADGKHSKSAEDEDDQHQYSSLFIKNLNFSTSEVNLRDHLLQLGVEGLRTVLIQKKQIGKNMLSQGYGFAEFKSPDHATKALAKMKGSLLDSHALEVKPSDKRLTTAPAAAARSLLANASAGVGGAAGAGGGNNKLIVRNVAFQASKAEIRDLFSAFGSVKRVRIPKKMGGEHRGFAFVDFSTGQEAALAMASLRNTHLYGRHLVLEWAKEEDDQEAELTGMEGFAALGGGRNKVGLHSNNSGGGVRSGETAGTALDRLRKKARQDERVIAQTNSNKRARVQDILDTSTGGVGSDDV